jgi:haloacetate dehalogenase
MLEFAGFESRFITANGIRLRVQTGGQGPALLLLHGHPQTQAMWHKVAPTLAREFRVVLADLRGYGDSDKPAGSAGHENHSKRVMAADQAAVMSALGHERFRVLAHDRGARVAHRLAVDHAERVERLVLLDIAPTLAMYEQTSMAFATAYFHWFWHIQPQPLPETLIGHDPVFYIRSLMGGRHAGLKPFTAEALAEYERCIQLPGAIHGVCEDYRASATIDLEHDRADRDAGRQLTVPTLVLWGAHGVIQRCFEPLKEWQRVATDVRGHAVPSGHYIAEEIPQQLLDETLPFLRGVPAA